MKFPAANISIKNWDKNEDYLLYILADEFLGTSDNELYQKYFQDNLFVDSIGEIYKVIDRKIQRVKKRFLFFTSSSIKVELVFKRIEENMTMEQVRQHILNQLNILENQEYKLEWIEKVKKATTFEEIIMA
jgi:hypothetical protein